jgi:hypothetical protein
MDAHNPENSMPYFPTDNDWTLVTRPERIPLDERFPKKYTVNSLPFAANRHLGLAPKNSRTRGKGTKKRATDKRGAGANKQVNC